MGGFVGQNVGRLDGIAKVTGQAKYLDDLDIPGVWHGVALRSPIPHGKIKKITRDESFDWSRVIVCDHTDIPGKNCTYFLNQDQPVLAETIVRHVGEPILLIAAPNKELAEQAIKHIHVAFDELKPVLSIEESQKKEIIVCGKDNV